MTGASTTRSLLAWRPQGAWDYVTVVAVVAALLVPFVPGSVLASRLYDITMIIMLYMVLALGLNIVVGWVGLLDLGYVGFVLIGVYTTVIVSAWIAPMETVVAPEAGTYHSDRGGGTTVLRPDDPVSPSTVAGELVTEAGTLQIVCGTDGRFRRTLVQDGEQVSAGQPLFSLRPSRSHPFVFMVVMAIAALHALVWGLIRGVPVLRLRDDYFAIVTFAFAEVVYSVVKNEVWLTGGPKGYPSEHAPNLGLWQLEQNSVPLYYFVAAMVALTTIAMVRLSRSRIGRAWFAIRADETSAQTSGVAVNRFKMLAFAISALIAGLGGAMMGFQYHVISTNTFDFWLSVIVLCCIVLGGMGSIRGVLIGTAILMGLGELLRDLLPQIGVDERARMLFYGLVMIGIMIFRARGVHPPSVRREPFGADEAHELAREPATLYALREGTP